jgi:hypothetical protein
MKERENKVGRRTVMAGAGAAGALAAVATLLQPRAAPPAGAQDTGPLAADATPGYRLTEHVKRYYRTARV